jgi:DNA-binding CsgD family transcriptional regulator
MAAAHSLQVVGSAAWRQNALPAARTALERALALLNDRQDAERGDAERGDAERGDAERGDAERGDAERGDAERGDAERGQVLAELALLPVRSAREWARSEVYTRQALDIADRVGDAHLDAAAARAAVAGPYARAHNLALGRRLLRRALERAEKGNDASAVADACLSLAATCAWTAEIREADEIAARGAAAVAAAHGLPLAARRLAGVRGMLGAARGDWVDAGATGGPRSLNGHAGGSLPALWGHLANAFTAYQRERYDDAERAILDARPLAGSLVVRLVFGGVLGLVHVAVGQLELAGADLADLAPLLRNLPEESVYAVPALAAHALHDLARGDRRHAAMTYTALLPFRGLMPWILVDRALGELATLLGDWEAAERHLGEAGATAAREGLRPERMRTLEAWADLEAARGGVGSFERERDWMGRARELADALGLEETSRRLRARLHTLARRADEPGTPSAPAGLTGREVDVLRLLAAGQSNRRIARELGLSEKTVAHHVSSIRTKTACENRAAAAFAVRHGLA